MLPALPYIGLGLDILSGNIYDLNSSIITFDKNINQMEIIYHKNLKSIDGSIIHYDDNRTGFWEGDDELLSVNLARVNPNVNTLVVIVNSFKGNNMVRLRSAFLRLFK